MRVLFLCVHNSGRSQMAEAFLRELAGDRGMEIESCSAGTLGGTPINPAALAAMQEIGISMESQFPKQLTSEMSASADRIISMGCGVDQSQCPARFLVTEDWGLDDPAGQPVEVVREIRDQIRARVEILLDELAREA